MGWQNVKSFLSGPLTGKSIINGPLSRNPRLWYNLQVVPLAVESTGYPGLRLAATHRRGAQYFYGETMRNLWQGSDVWKPGQPRSQPDPETMESEHPARPRSRGKNPKADEGLHELHSQRTDCQARLIDGIKYNTA